MLSAVHFVTTNRGKIATLERFLKGTGVVVIPKSLEITEIQAASVETIVLHKANEARRHIELPLLVHDSGVFIKSLGGFPGPYAKYVEDTFGQKRLASILRPDDDRSCLIVKSLAYIDQNGVTHIFNQELHGKLSLEPQIPNDESSHWSSLFTIFIPEGWNKPISMFSQKELGNWEKTSGQSSEFAQLRDLLAKNH